MALKARSDSLKRLDKRLKELSKRVPGWEEVYKTLFGLAELKHNPTALDRTAAVVGASFIEHGLQKAITVHLKRDLGEHELKELFEAPLAPLGSFHAKILLAQALGIIADHNVRRDLDTIRTIRNAFAHSMTHIAFNDEEVRNLCLTLTIANSFSDDFWRGDPTIKNVYISAIAEIFFGLTDYYDDRKERNFT